MNALTATGSVLGTLSATYLLWKEAKETKTVRKLLLAHDMRKHRSFTLNDNLHFVHKQSVDKAIAKGFADPYGGIQVMHAPSGSGKSSHLKSALANEEKNRPALYLSKFISAKQFYSRLHMKEYEIVSEFVPPNAVIVIDQMEQTELTAEVRSVIRHLATDSRGSGGKYNVILCFSEAEAARKVLMLNGMDKIIPMCDRSVFHWGEQEINYFSQQACVDWTPEQIKRLESLTLKAKCPGFLQHVLHSFPAGIPLEDEEAMKALETTALRYHAKWNDPLLMPTPTR